ncbi:MAG TPA: hypothetical protein VNB94_01090 [Mycobacteriales bacterium]|nr:hypothetical protein [Mycobacteriales bacterium]
MSVPAARLTRLGAVLVAAVALGGLAPAASAQEGFPGTIKVSGVLEAPTPDNQANPGCTARIDFYNFNLGTYDVLFTAMPPSGTREVLRSVVTLTRESPQGNDVQQSAQYRLNVTGLATDGPGYKLRVEVSDPAKSGGGGKSKVFSFLCLPQSVAPSGEVLGTRGVAGAAPVGGFDTGRGGAAGALPVLPMVALAVGVAAVGAGAVVGRRRRRTT